MILPGSRVSHKNSPNKETLVNALLDQFFSETTRSKLGLNCETVREGFSINQAS